MISIYVYDKYENSKKRRRARERRWGGEFRGDIYTLFISELIDWTLWKRVNKRKI